MLSVRKVLLLAIIFVAAILYVYFRPPSPVATVNDIEVKEVGTFEECVREGNRIEESYPPACRTKSGKTLTQNIGNEMILKDKIRIDSPRPNQKITSPLLIKGEARGMWFFEGQFSAKLLNPKGEVIGEGIMTATEGWMTEEFVPYTGEIVFESLKTGKGELVLEKNNPSGLLEKSEALIVPVEFK